MFCSESSQKNVLVLTNFLADQYPGLATSTNQLLNDLKTYGCNVVFNLWHKTSISTIGCTDWLSSQIKKSDSVIFIYCRPEQFEWVNWVCFNAVRNLFLTCVNERKCSFKIAFCKCSIKLGNCLYLYFYLFKFCSYYQSITLKDAIRALCYYAKTVTGFANKISYYNSIKNKKNRFCIANFDKPQLSNKPDNILQFCHTWIRCTVQHINYWIENFEEKHIGGSGSFGFSCPFWQKTTRFHSSLFWQISCS